MTRGGLQERKSHGVARQAINCGVWKVVSFQLSAAEVKARHDVLMTLWTVREAKRKSSPGKRKKKLLKAKRRLCC